MKLSLTALTVVALATFAAANPVPNAAAEAAPEPTYPNGYFKRTNFETSGWKREPDYGKASWRRFFQLISRYPYSLWYFAP
ncbi:hypothetical protein PsYK624_019930 [Phanerochaete sordida]|uniref:Uncharacterized protein n=1 Tax=Phanerochaete sordida TaxID=48140 RepID=A0A9P3G0D4_9APHY|nr:hypothetical protein PsYK624_019930 [Phanerochaete sordida]